MRDELRQSGTNPNAFQIAKRVYIHVDDDRERALGEVDAALTHHYGRRGLSSVAVYGPPAACAAGLREVADAGAQLILLNPLVDDARQMERLAAEVIPELG